MNDSSHQHRQRTISTLIGCAAVLFWGASLPLSKSVGLSFGQYSAAGFVLMTSGVLGYLVLPKSTTAVPVRLLLLRLFLYTAYLVPINTAISYTSTEALPIIILSNYVWPIATVLWSIKLLKLPVSPLRLTLGLLLVAGGLFLELGGSSLLNIPRPALWVTLMALGAALTWGLYSALNRVYGERWGGVSKLPFVMLWSGAIVWTIGVLKGEPFDFNNVKGTQLFIYSFLPLLGGFCWDRGTREGNIVIVGFVADLTPWVSLFTASVLLGSPLHPHMFGAALLILSGAWVCRRMGS